MKGQAHVGDVGFEILVLVKDRNAQPLDLSGVTSKEFALIDPAGNVTVLAPSFVTNGTDGLLNYLTQSTDLTTAGTWGVQVKLTWSGGTLLRSTVATFLVGEAYVP